MGDPTQGPLPAAGSFFRLSSTLERTRRRTSRRWIGILLCLSSLAACSEAEQAAPEPPTTSTGVAATTTTTIGTTTTTEDPEIAAVRGTYTAFLAMFEVVGNPPNPDHPEIARLATGDAYERLRASLAQSAAEGHHSDGGWDSAIQRIEVHGAEARIEDCSLDLGRLLTSDGQELVPADSQRFLRTARLAKDAEGWKVWRLERSDPPQTCDA